MAYAEEQRMLIVGKFNLLRVGGREQLLQLLESLARNQNALLTADAFKRLVGLFDVREPVAVGGHHRQRLRLDHQQGAVERVARLLV